MLKIIGIGDNVVDRYLYKNKMYPGGNAVNVPVLAHKTGMAKSAYLGCVGDDFAGAHILASLRAEGIDVSRVRVLPGKTAFADVTLIDSERTFIGGEDGVSKQIALSPDDDAFIQTFSLVHTSIYSGIDALLAHIKSLGLPIAYDYSDRPHWEKMPESLMHVDYAVFSGGHAPTEELKEHMRTAALAGPRQILMTMGSRGSMLFDGTRFYEQAIYPIENIVDTMGAGDSFIARYLAGIYGEESIEESMAAAAQFAAQNCLVNGTFGYETEIQ